MNKNNEQIIIDGVYVSTCEFYSGGLCNIPDSIETFDSCMDKNPNCYYKQLKRKEQECEELKSTNKIYEQGIARLKDEKKNLKKENNSLKETIDGLLSIQYKLADNCLKYSQTLEEIREIAENTISSADEICCHECDGGAINAEKILIKINEVSNGDI